MQQQFWPHHVVVRLAATSFPGWHHRPAVAVDTAGNGTFLTEGVVRVLQQQIIEGFNTIARQEFVRIDEGNVRPYAEFFLYVHLQNSEDVCVVAPGSPVKSCGRPTFNICFDHGRSSVAAELVHLKAEWRTMYRFRIEDDGTVAVEQTPEEATCTE